MERVAVGVLGARSLVADSLLRLLREAYSVLTFSRHETVVPARDERAPGIPYWISLMPIWALPNYFEMLLSHRARRIVALSSTSALSKMSSTDWAERALAHRLMEGERRFIAWAENEHIEWLILRPTLIYGGGRDRNISEIARFIRRFGFFPVLGQGSGLRQPIHAEDVASACKLALEAENIANSAYNISGGETLTYRDMLVRIFDALGKTPRIITLPLWAFRGAVACLRILPRFREWSSAMAERMNLDLAFDHSAATRDCGFSPRPFQLSAADLVAARRLS